MSDFAMNVEFGCQTLRGCRTSMSD